MLKDTDKFETSAHFSYNEYKRKVKKSPNKDVMVFASVFIIGVLIILGFAKILSPNVDVGIHVEDETAAVFDDTDDGAGSVVDERLRKLQLEDEGKRAEDEQMFSPELDERVVLPRQVRKTVGQMEAEKANTETIAHQQEEKQEHQKPAETFKPVVTETKIPVQKAPTTTPVGEPIVNAKVVVGYYATEKQAEVAKSIIQDAGLSVTPIVKNLGGYYTLQVGSYTSREKAQQAANGLLKSNFPARVIVE